MKLPEIINTVEIQGKIYDFESLPEDIRRQIGRRIQDTMMASAGYGREKEASELEPAPFSENSAYCLKLENMIQLKEQKAAKEKGEAVHVEQSQGTPDGRVVWADIEK